MRRRPRWKSQTQKTWVAIVQSEKYDKEYATYADGNDGDNDGDNDEDNDEDNDDAKDDDEATKKHLNDEERGGEELGRVDLSSRCPLIIGHVYAKPEMIIVIWYQNLIIVIIAIIISLP